MITLKFALYKQVFDTLNAYMLKRWDDRAQLERALGLAAGCCRSRVIVQGNGVSGGGRCIVTRWPETLPTSRLMFVLLRQVLRSRPPLIHAARAVHVVL